MTDGALVIPIDTSIVLGFDRRPISFVSVLSVKLTLFMTQTYNILTNIATNFWKNINRYSSKC